MRIRPTTWLAATASLAGVAWGTGNEIIIFQDTYFLSSDSALDGAAILLSSHPNVDLEPLIVKNQSKEFFWTAKDGTTVNRVNLYVNNTVALRTPDMSSNDAAPDSTVTTSSSIAHPSSGGGSFGPHERRQQTDQRLVLSELSVAVNAILLASLAPNPNDPAMYFEAIWTNSAGSTGTSYSRNFTVMADFNAQGSGTFNLVEKFKDSSPAKSEISAQATSSPTSSSPGQLPSSSTATAAPVSSSSGGLSTGAIAGIAVGCGVVGLAIIAGTIWFCCRRRRQDGMAGYGEARNRTQELMAEKEANGGVDVAPHSPYSDDGTGGLTGNGVHHHTDSLMAGGAAGVGMAAAADYQHHSPPSAIDRSYTPYSDRPIASMGSPATQRASIGAGRTESAHASEHDLEPHAAPGGIRSATSASQYAHLVEDGMTEDEIRRIEEEERQLDAAIQQAGTRR